MIRIVAAARRRIQVGEKFNKLTLIGEPFYVKRQQQGVFGCDCGTIIHADLRQVIKGGIKSCKCHRKSNTPMLRHGESSHGRVSRLYRACTHMLGRCYCESDGSYSNYGGRGISVCDEWRSFEPFSAWAKANGYSNELTIDRIDNDGNYEPGNCRWASRKTQNNNQRKNVIVEAFGERKTASEWADDPRCTVCYYTLVQRIRKLKWDHEQALSLPSSPLARPLRR